MAIKKTAFHIVFHGLEHSRCHGEGHHVFPGCAAHSFWQRGRSSHRARGHPVPLGTRMPITWHPQQGIPGLRSGCSWLAITTRATAVGSPARNTTFVVRIAVLRGPQHHIFRWNILHRQCVHKRLVASAFLTWRSPCKNSSAISRLPEAAMPSAICFRPHHLRSGRSGRKATSSRKIR